VAVIQTGGTPGYASPEHWLAPDKVDSRSDIFSIGACLYFAVTSEAPYQAEGDKLIDLEKLSRIPLPSHKNPLVPADLDQVCLKCLRPHPEDRYQDAQTLADELYPIYRRLEREAGVSA